MSKWLAFPTGTESTGRRQCQWGKLKTKPMAVNERQCQTQNYMQNATKEKESQRERQNEKKKSNYENKMIGIYRARNLRFLFPSPNGTAHSKIPTISMKPICLAIYFQMLNTCGCSGWPFTDVCWNGLKWLPLTWSIERQEWNNFQRIVFIRSHDGTVCFGWCDLFSVWAELALV